MNDIAIVAKYELVKKLAESVGITVKHNQPDQFTIADIPKATGNLSFKSLDELSMFIDGYSLGYKSTL